MTIPPPEKRATTLPQSPGHAPRNTLAVSSNTERQVRTFQSFTRLEGFQAVGGGTRDKASTLRHSLSSALFGSILWPPSGPHGSCILHSRFPSAGERHGYRRQPIGWPSIALTTPTQSLVDWSPGHRACPMSPLSPTWRRGPGSRPTAHGAARGSSSHFPFLSQTGSPASLLLRPLPPPRELETPNCKAPPWGEWEEWGEP